MSNRKITRLKDSPAGDRKTSGHSTPFPSTSKSSEILSRRTQVREIKTSLSVWAKIQDFFEELSLTMIKAVGVITILGVLVIVTAFEVERVIHLI